MKLLQIFLIVLLGPLYYLRKYPFGAILSIPVIILLTVITQIGGVVFWSSFACIPFLSLWLQKYKFIRFVIFQHLLYLFITLFIIPSLARLSNQEARMSLPLFATKHFPIQPRNIFYALLNRNYVDESSYQSTQKIAKQMNQKYPGTKLIYYDANFPFEWKFVTSVLRKLGVIRSYVTEFPLYPHLSHSDGKKLDMGFFYHKNGKEINYTPTWIGYGGLEPPKPGEVNIPCSCRNYWNYNFWLYLKSDNPCEIKAPQESHLTLDHQRTRDAINFFIQNTNVQYIILESHLDHRLGLGQKTKPAGCHATRHDDHFHVVF